MACAMRHVGRLRFGALACVCLRVLAAAGGEYDDLTVPSKAGVNEISASASSLAGPAGAFASDSDSNSRFATKATSVTLQYRFVDGSIPVVTNFSLMPPKSGGTAYAPREIALYGSNTGESSDWVLLTEVKGLTWTADTERKYFPFENKKPYLWYRWSFKNPSGGTYIGCQSVQLLGFKVEDDALYIIGEPFMCGSVTPDYSLRSGLAEGEKVPCSASGESFYYAGGDYWMTANGWKLYGMKEDGSDFEVVDEGDELELEYSHPGKRRILAWQFDAKPCVAIAAAEHGSAAADKPYYAVGKYATLTATADTGYGFAYWTGDVPDGDKYDNPLLLRMDAPKSVTPVFLPAKTVTPGGAETPQQAINSLGADGGVLFMEEGTYTYDAAAPALYLT
ncbi:MAG: hypothetical protein MJ138_08215, partial [Kiritimatiellae bacterium]|nr:hypothetical protein [Kiritimatiellia bacterium]